MDASATSPRSRWWAVGQVLLFIVVCQLAGVLGVVTSPTGDTAWYRSLAKPVFNPPSWLFGPVWTLLYTLMGVAVYRVWRMDRSRPAVRLALGLFAAQLLLNAIWTPVFFGAQSLAGGAVVIVVLLIVLVITTARFFRLDRWAGSLLVPYVLWVAFATLLNVSILMLNR